MATTHTWDSFAKSAQKTEEADYGDERQHVPDGTYHATVIRVGEPYDKLNSVSGEMQTKFVAEFSLFHRRLKGEKASLPTFITLPPKYLDGGFLSEKSNLYKVMKALGFDLSGRFKVDPPSWAEDGLTCDVVVENQEKKNDDGQLVETSWITKFTRCACDEDDLPKKRKEPVVARRGATATFEDDE